MTAAFIVVAWDAINHRIPRVRRFTASAREMHPVPFPITPLADSPFLNSRPFGTGATPTAIAAGNSEPTSPGEKHNAPFGVYFLKVPVQTESDEGPVTFGPGTQVRLLRHQAGKIRVTRNGTDFLVEDSQLTNDLETVAALAGTSS